MNKQDRYANKVIDRMEKIDKVINNIKVCPFCNGTGKHRSDKKTILELIKVYFNVKTNEGARLIYNRYFIITKENKTK